jgi:hypothetical protein
MRALLLVAFTGWIAIASACSSSPPTIKAADYDRTCTSVSDCEYIEEGSACCITCANAAINKKDDAKYQQAVAQRRSACGTTACPAIACDPAPLGCVAGRCTVCSSPSSCPAGTRA